MGIDQDEGDASTMKRQAILSDPDDFGKTTSITRLFLARHAETSDPNRFHGAESDVGLSKWGEKQAELLGERLRGEPAIALYSSAMLRARTTAAIVGGRCGLEPRIEPALHERKIGALSGVSREEGWATYAESRARWLAGDLEFTHEGGESFAAVRRRVVPVLESLAERHRGRTIIVIAHGVVIRVALVSLLDHLGHQDFDKIAIEFASLNELVHDGQRWSAGRLSEVVAPSDAKPVA